MTDTVTVPVYIKDPNTTLWYGIDWSNRLEDDVTIVASAWEAPTGISKQDQTIEGGVTYVLLAGGTLGFVYIITNRILKSNGELEDQTIRIIMRHT